MIYRGALKMAVFSTAVTPELLRNCRQVLADRAPPHRDAVVALYTQKSCVGLGWEKRRCSPPRCNWLLEAAAG